MSERDVERACAAIANSLHDNGFRVSDSLVRSLEHKGLLPGAKKLYSLCRAYQISPFEVYAWYGIPFGELLQQRLLDLSERTVLVDFEAREFAGLRPAAGAAGGLHAETTQLIEETKMQWGESLAPLLLRIPEKHFLFGKVGKDDLFLYPLVPPGSLLVIDPARTALEPHQQGSYWTRPIYFLELKGECAFGYCEMLSSGRLLLTPHADSPDSAREIEVSDEWRITGRVISIAIPSLDRQFGNPKAL